MQTFEIAPANVRGALWIVVPVALLLLGVIFLLFRSVSGATQSRFEVSAEGLRVRGDLYGRTIPSAELRVAEARRVDLAREDGLRPKWRMMGTGLPGYQSGWFKLRNGEKALLYLTDRSKAVYVPTTRGYSLLLSPVDADGFLAALKDPGAPPL